MNRSLKKVREMDLFDMDQVREYLNCYNSYKMCLSQFIKGTNIDPNDVPYLMIEIIEATNKLKRLIKYKLVLDQLKDDYKIYFKMIKNNGR